MSDHDKQPCYANRVLSYLTATSALPDEASVWKFMRAAFASMPEIHSAAITFGAETNTAKSVSSELIETLVAVRHSQTLFANLHLYSQELLDTAFLDAIRSAANLLALEISRRRLQSQMEERILDSTLELSRLNNRYELAIGASGAGLWEWRPDSQELIWDDRMLEIYEVPRSDFTGTYENWQKFLHPDDLIETENSLNRALEKGVDFGSQFRIETTSGIKHIQASAKFVAANASESEYFLGTNFDSTETWQLNEQLRQTQRLESLGKLTGGIAHDFNNILSAIMGSAEVMQLLATERGENEFSRLIDDMIEATERGKSLTSRLLAFARKDQLTPTFLDISEIIGHLTVLMSRTLGDQISLATDFDKTTLTVNIDRHQLENCLLNLVLNARDAMPSGGRITISTHAKHFDNASDQVNSNIHPGSYAEIIIQDEGVGIPDSDMDRVIEPFYTTKPQEHGTGLGLSMAHGFVTQSDGYFDIKSTFGKGTQISILLPTVGEPVKAVVKEERELEEGTFGGTVLLLEDDEAVAKISITFLQTLGFEVLRAATGHEALAIFNEHQNKITLLLTDISLPGDLNGFDVVERIRSRNPNIVAIFASGYPQAFKESSESLQTNTNFLQKPYRLKALRDAISKNLPSIPV